MFGGGRGLPFLLSRDTTTSGVVSCVGMKSELKGEGFNRSTLNLYQLVDFSRRSASESQPSFLFPFLFQVRVE